MPVICASVFLEYLLDLVTLNNMLLIMVNIVYHDVFVDGAVVFDRLVNSVFCTRTLFLNSSSRNCSMSGYGSLGMLNIFVEFEGSWEYFSLI